MESPFEYGKVSFKETFNNRKADIAALQANFRNKVHTILISPRRWGKTSLVKQAALLQSQEDSKYRFCFIDLFSIRSEEAFYEALTKTVIKATSSKWEDWVSSAKEFLQNLSPQISLSSVPGTDFDISIQFSDSKRQADEILELAERLAEKKKIRIIICIDEFQNLSFFKEPLAFQKQLRASWQHHKHVSYCLYGSKRHMMSALFEKQNNPFYKFGDVRYLQKIQEPHWVDFIVKRFQSTKKTISPELARKIAQTMDNHSYYVQQLAHEVWVRSKRTATEQDLVLAIDDVITRNSILYQRDFEQLSNTQINFLRLLNAGINSGFSSKKHIQEYDLGTSANVIRIISALENKEIIDRMDGKLALVDPVFGSWLKRLF